MDLLGSKNEEDIEALNEKVESFERKLRDFEDGFDEVREKFVESDGPLEVDLSVTDENRKRLRDLEEMLSSVVEVQSNILEEVRTNRSKESRVKSDLENRLNALEAQVDNMEVERNKRSDEVDNRVQVLDDRMSELSSELDSVENELEQVEEEIVGEIDANRDVLDSKVFEEDLEKELNSIRQSISKVKSSINMIADEEDQDKIRIE